MATVKNATKIIYHRHVLIIPLDVKLSMINFLDPSAENMVKKCEKDF